MSYLGFAGSGTVGNFSSTTVLQNMYPAQRYAGRFATVENTPGIVDLYFSTGNAWVTSTDSGMLGAFASTAALQAAFPAASNGGKHAFISTAPYGQYVSNGTNWVNVPTLNSTNTSLVSGDGTLGFGLALLSNALPMLLPSSGSVGANGALTLTTNVSLSGGYTWGCYMYFPAGACYSGSLAGMYYVVMSSINAGTIYNDTYTTGTPTVPTSPTPIVDAGPGAYTQTTGQITLAKVSVPANSMGRNGLLMCDPGFLFPNNANSKTVSLYFGGSVVYGKTRTTSTTEVPLVDIRNAGITNRQISKFAQGAGPGTSLTSGVTRTAVDTTAAVDVEFRAQLATATDYIELIAGGVILYPFP